MENTENPFSHVPAWAMILTAALIAASGPAFFHEEAYVGAAAGVLTAFVYLKWRDIPFRKRLLRSVGCGALIGILAYPLSIALCYAAGFVDGFVNGFAGTGA
jgi:hypothetical protein